MVFQSVRYRKQLEIRGESDAPVALSEAIARVKKMAGVSADRKYKNGKKRKGDDQTIEIAMNLGIDARQADQMLRGAITLPKGLGKTRSVIAFCQGPMVEEAKEAGATEAGGEELVEKIQKGWLDFDVAVAHPSMMGKVGKLGRILGPQGKMPTPKAGTVTPDVVDAVKAFGGGRLEFRNDKGGNIHLAVGRSSFADADLEENITAVIDHITKLKPAAAKGQFVKRVCISGTQTPSVAIETGA